ncbi:MAG: phytoene desaturase [Hyphomicrobium sp.]|nr:phytoene desaturase [Hyphomicrobium sp.]
MTKAHAVVVGAGIAGLTAAIDLAVAGFDVTVVERAPSPGGKMRQVQAGGAVIDAGPTVLTMARVFEELFASAGAKLSDYVSLEPLQILARHAWTDGSILDLFADRERSASAIAKFSDAREADGFLKFCKRAEGIFKTLEDSFIRSESPTPVSLALQSGITGLGDLWRISPFTTLWSALGNSFRDPRLRQLFGRYATYCGSSPFEAPATLMLVADVERQGVWTVNGGMQRLAAALAALATDRGVVFRYDSDVTGVVVTPSGVQGVTLTGGETVPASFVVLNADPEAVAGGHFGRDAKGAVSVAANAVRSLSAITVALTAKTKGFPLHRHNVFFSSDYKREFDDIFKARRLPTDPTIYICASDRHDWYDAAFEDRERLLCLINAPAIGDTYSFGSGEIQQCLDRMFAQLKRYGLDVDTTSEEKIITTPNGFNHLFPATGGALYGQASHGWTASFNRPHARTKIPHLYLAGGATHPGPGVPMAALSGRFAARAATADRDSQRRLIGMATPGGTSTP